MKTWWVVCLIVGLTAVGTASDVQAQNKEKERKGNILERIILASPVQPVPEYAFKNSGQQISVIIGQFRNESTWDNVFKKSFTYKAGGETHIDYYAFTENGWEADGGAVYTIAENGLPLKTMVRYTAGGSDIFKQEFFYNEVFELDSLHSGDIFFGENSVTKVYFTYHDSDSISYTGHSTGSDAYSFSGYFSYRGNRLISEETDNYGEYTEKYRMIYMDMDFNDLLRSLASEYLHYGYEQEYYDDFSGEYVSDYRQRVEYDSRNGLLRRLFIEWYNNGNWETENRDEFAYDEENRLNQILRYYYNWEAGEWEVGYRDVFSYQTGVSIEEPPVNLPDHFELHQNYPNPFNPVTQIPFTLHRSGEISLKVYNSNGMLVKDFGSERLSAGTYTRTFTGGSFSSGLYFARLESSDIQGKHWVQSVRMLLIK